MLKLIDGFDHYETADFLRKWDVVDNTIAISTSYGRYGSGGMKPSGGSNGGYVGKNLPAANTGYGFFGTAVYVPNMGPSGFSLLHGVCNPAITSARDISSYILSDGSLGIGTDGGGAITLLAQTAPGLVVAGAFQYLETGIKVHSVSGEVIIRLDGIEVLSYTGNTRRASGVDEFRQVRIFLNSGVAGEQWFDDFYYCDDTGAKNNDFLGDVRIQTIYSNALGDISDWTRTGAASDILAVNEHPAIDDDTGYLSAAVVGDQFLHNLDGLASPVGRVVGVAVNHQIRKDDGGAREISALVKAGGSVGTGTAYSTPSSYGNRQTIFESSPATAVDFTLAEIAALQAGAEVIA